MSASTPKAPPVDKTRAIVEAASEVARVCGDQRDGYGDELPEAEAALQKLSAALALPEPEWTTTVPSEPGWYWRRVRLLAIPPAASEPHEWHVTAHYWRAHPDEYVSPLVEWIPVPIEPPRS